MMIFDLLEHEGQDLRNEPFSAPQELLEKLFEGLPLARLQLAPLIHESTWERCRTCGLRAGCEVSKV